jgi:hypothetical protein
MLTPSQTDHCHREGYVIVPNVFSAAEVAAFRGSAAAHGTSGTVNCALHTVPALAGLWLDPRLIAIAKDLLDGPITYFAESAYSRYGFSENAHSIGRHLHHDAKGMRKHLFNRRHEASERSYPAVRFGIYLQDYAVCSGALKVSPGSHKIDTSDFDQAKLPYVNIASRPGDVVCFCMRTLHSGLSVRLKNNPEIALSPAEEDIQLARTPEAFLPNPPLREIIFLDYVGMDEAADLYIKNRVCHSAQSIEGMVAAFQSQGMAAAAAAAGITLRMDAAVVESVVRATQATVGGIIQKEGLPYLRALPSLCRHAAEFSPYFSLIPKLDDSYTLKTVVLLKNEIGRRLQAYTATGATKAPDLHMQGTEYQPAYAIRLQEIAATKLATIQSANS